MREVVLDTETTGLTPKTGHRIVEIGCVELVNLVPTGNVYHVYINPQRDMPEEAFNVHGLSESFLRDKPLFEEIAEDFLEFVDGAQLVIHNAEFDMGFLNAELKLLNRAELANIAVDTVRMARKKFPGAHANLDALCRRFGIDNSAREKHGALLDAELLAEVYLELTGGRQPGLLLSGEEEAAKSEEAQVAKKVERSARAHAASPSELAAHAEFLEKIDDPIWRS
ncbi:MAG: DNA polymerase III subunit epsilon [Rhodospirillaceae bacterium]|jgi:DNA polymerase III subunit epsilon|nr:DNA polymerase III subunit epsilon [Rhodospirillaceae bacterium]MBT3787666.1 DNA polymerase III subunit epsilon [Alphaproteobacteria bacterium]MBT4084967.1 DNA polymerase III subunit epsilon [Alphaproteobacteria bacterium]MBT4545515.1 DNA polymerase III subunit epsilon [Alphaproteobacteria bacterium]MBT6386430.1 DNA polymerase III subunit epsilon [Alphaproteobacteria bacterium]